MIVAGEKDQVDGTDAATAATRYGNGFSNARLPAAKFSAERIDKLIRGLVSSEEAETAIETHDRRRRQLADRASRGRGSPTVEMLLKELDRPVDSSRKSDSVLQVRNANAIEVLYSLLALQQATGSGQVAQVGGLGSGAVWHARRLRMSVGSRRPWNFARSVQRGLWRHRRTEHSHAV